MTLTAAAGGDTCAAGTVCALRLPGARPGAPGNASFPEEFDPAFAAAADALLALSCTNAAGAAPAALTGGAAAAAPAAALMLGGFESGGSPPYAAHNNLSSPAALPAGVCHFAAGDYSSQYLGGRCAVPCIQYLGFDEAYWRNPGGAYPESAGFCGCHAQASPGGAEGSAAGGRRLGGAEGLLGLLEAGGRGRFSSRRAARCCVPVCVKAS